MKIMPLLSTLLVLLVILPAVAAADSLLAQMDALNRADGVANQKKALELGVQAVENDPDSYEARWKLARACAYYTYCLQEELVDGWEDQCKVYGKTGMAHAEKALELAPDCIEGHYFFAFNAGMYSYGVSIFSAIAEGLKDKTQHHFETVCEMNPRYEEGAALVSLGRFWHQLPWPLKDKDKALAYYRAYQQTSNYGKDPNSLVIMAELLADLGGREHQQEAADILAAALNDPACGPYYRRIGEKVQEEL